MNKLRVVFKNPEEVLKFVSTVEKYPFEMDIERGKTTVDAKSLLGIISMGMNSIVDLKIYADECKDLEMDIANFIAA